MTIASEQRNSGEQACRDQETNERNRTERGWMNQQHVQRKRNCA